MKTKLEAKKIILVTEVLVVEVAQVVVQVTFLEVAQALARRQTSKEDGNYIVGHILLTVN